MNDARAILLRPSAFPSGFLGAATLMLFATMHPASAPMFAQSANEPARKSSPLPPPTYANVSYGPHERHTLDFWAGRGSAAPLVIFIHGGGWHGGDKNQLPGKLLTAMRGRGIAVASINYRFTSMAPLPAPVHDAARAVQFLRTNAAYWKLNSTRFAAYGISAGGCTALWLAYHDDLADPKNGDPVAGESSRLQAAVGVSPQTSLDPEVVPEWIGPAVTGHAMVPRAVGGRNWEDARTRNPQWLALLREFSPINHVSAGDPPVLLLYPTFGAIPATDAGAGIHHAMFGQKLKERADALGVPCVLRIEDQKTNALTPTPHDFLFEHLLQK